MQYNDKNTLSLCSKLVLVVTGGIGRNIMGTAVVRALKKAWPKKDIVVMAGCPEVFGKNPNIQRVHNMGRPSYIYEDYFQKNKSMVMSVEPYQHLEYTLRTKHFIDCWCDLLGIEPAGIEPEVYYNLSEVEMAKDYLSKFDKPMVLFQHQGGKVPEEPNKKARLIAKSGMYKRNLPENVAQQVTDGLIERGYMVGSVGHPNQFLPKGAEQVKFPIRAIVALVPHVAGVLTIDSFLLHASACYKGVTPTVALWGGTNPQVLGYPWHRNIVRQVCDTPMCHRPNSYLWDFEESGFLWDCPHNDICMNYKAEDILKEFDIAMEKEKPNDSRKSESDGRKSEGRWSEEANAKCPESKDKSCGKEGVPCNGKGELTEKISANSRAN